MQIPGHPNYCDCYKCNIDGHEKLTQNQIGVIQALRRQGCEFIAEETRRQWVDGNQYYIDSRVNVRGIRRDFMRGNREAVELWKATNNNRLQGE